MQRIGTLLYGIVCYAIFFASFLYLVGFVGDLAVPKSIDSGAAGPLGRALVVNTLLLALFGLKLYRATNTAELVGWSLVVGGGLSNLIDRVMRDGRVVDFLRVGFGDFRTGIFNLADTAIVLGLVCLFASALWLRGSRIA